MQIISTRQIVAPSRVSGMMKDTKRRAFTLVEMLVVIGIAALLTAMIFPVAKSLTSGNKAMTCSSRLHQIGIAIKLYTLDEGGVPPYYPSGGVMVGSGLLALFDTNYVRSDMTLNCPSDSNHKYRSRVPDVGHPDANGDGISDDFWAMSYSCMDPTANPGTGTFGATGGYTFLSCRGVDTAGFRRQLCEYDTLAGLPATRRGYLPDDTAVVTWCPAHVNSVTVGNSGIYQVLLWDGAVIRVAQEQMQNANPDANYNAAWLVNPNDAVGSGG